jgi:PAS domain S-box-containing protein
VQIEREHMEIGESGAWRSDILILVSGAAISVLLMFLLWEAAELRFATTDAIAHRMHYARGISSSLVTALVLGLLSYRQHLRRESTLEREVERRTKRLREAQSMLQLIVDTTPASLVLLDRGFRVVQANRSAEQVHGGALAGRVCFEALAGREDMCEECPAVHSFAGGGSHRVYGRRRDPRTGEVLEVECHPLTHDDGESYMLLVERIVTEQKKLEARLLHQEKMAAFGLLAAEVAHDMGNPLSSIDAQLQLLDERTLTSEAASVLRTVRGEVRRLHRILREIVDFARRRRDEATLVSVQEVVEDALRLLRHDRRMRAVELVEDFDAETPSVFMVEDHLVQVVLNLLINAVDAMPDGGTLRIELRPAGGNVALRIHDSGVGMEPAVLKQCLEPLFTTKDQGKGTGLGLSISKDILESAGGRIELFSAPERGTTVVVSLPAARTVREGASELASAT